MAQLTKAERTELYRPSKAPGWDRLSDDQRQKIEAIVAKVEELADEFVEVTDDTNPDSVAGVYSLRPIIVYAFADIAPTVEDDGRGNG